MKLVNEIVDALIVAEPEASFVCDTDTAGNILVPPEYLKAIVEAKLSPVFEAARDASTALGMALIEMEESGIKPTMLLETAVESVRENNVVMDLWSGEDV